MVDDYLDEDYLDSRYSLYCGVSESYEDDIGTFGQSLFSPNSYNINSIFQPILLRPLPSVSIVTVYYRLSNMISTTMNTVIWTKLLPTIIRHMPLRNHCSGSMNVKVSVSGLYLTVSTSDQIQQLLRRGYQCSRCFGDHSHKTRSMPPSSLTVHTMKFINTSLIYDQLKRLLQLPIPMD